VEFEGKENPMKVYKREDNDWTYMPSSPLIAFYFVLHTFSPFKPLEHQFVLQQTPQRLVMAAFSWIMGAYY
jgi:hypothetical protein